MDSIKVRRSDLLAALKENRAQHRETFEKALAGFRRKAVEVLEQRLDTARRGVNETIMVHVEMPKDQTKDYDRWIRAMEMDTRDEIELTMGEFACYVQDDWSWKDQFTRTTSQYI